MRPALIIITLLFTSLMAAAQQCMLSGRITDEQGQPVPFASIYLSNGGSGTSANNEGQYQLQLKAGEYTVQFKAIGYRQENKKVAIIDNQTLNIILRTEVYELKSVAINGNGEDAAYGIVRKAIKKRKFYLHEIKSFTCDIYIKGLQRLLDAPKKFMGRDIEELGSRVGLDSNRRGIIYLSESESKYSYEYPDKVHEEMIASKVSGNNRAFSYNRASDMAVNFYENYQNWGEISLRPLVSPIADNALFYYRYKYIGETIEDGHTINKIQVTPRRGHDPCFEGYIYIEDDSWRLTGINLRITKKANIRFVDTLNVNQQFLPVSGSIWMPSSVRFDFSASLLSFKLGGYFLSVYKNYQLNPPLQKQDFKEVLRITADVNKKDSTYWQQQRPVPLTDEEQTDYRRKEVLAAKRESKSYLDSIDHQSNTIKLRSFLMGGINIRNRYKKEFYHFDPIPSSLLYNTVEGFAINYGATYRKVDSLNPRRSFILGANIRYGFSDHLLDANARMSFPVGRFTLSAGGGSDVVDLNNMQPISTFVNSIYSLLRQENFKKMYHKTFATAALSGRVAGGWQASVSVEWASRRWLSNSSVFSIAPSSSQPYTSNNPFFPQADVPLFPENNSFKTQLRTSYNFSNKYETYPTGKRYLPSKYPTVGINYTKGIKDIFGSSVDYDQLSADITQENVSMGVYGKTSYYLAAGKFINATSLFYPDYKHFYGNSVLPYKPRINSFLLLDYYLFSTATEYVEGHLEHNFSGFITNKLPLIRKLKLEEILDVNYLSTPSLKNYYELGFGLQYFNFRLMYGRSYNGGPISVRDGIRLGLSF